MHDVSQCIAPYKDQQTFDVSYLCLESSYYSYRHSRQAFLVTLVDTCQCDFS
jgi:hypothetical protein